MGFDVCCGVQVGSAVEVAQGGVAQDIEGGMLVSAPTPASSSDLLPTTLQQDVTIYLFQTRPQ